MKSWSKRKNSLVIALLAMLATVLTGLFVYADMAYADISYEDLDRPASTDEVEVLPFEDFVSLAGDQTYQTDTYSSAEIYAPLINEYKRIFNGEKLNTSVMKTSQTGLDNCHCGTCYLKSGVLKKDATCPMNLAYAIRDLNGDGVDEIIFADTYDRGYDAGYQPYSIWTNDGQRPVFLTTSEYRVAVGITPAGIIKKFMSGGYETCVQTFQQISGTSLYQVAAVSYDYGDYYTDDAFEELSSEEEYNQIIRTYDTGDMSGFSWTTLKSTVVKTASKYPIKTFKIGSKNYTKKFKKAKDKEEKIVHEKSWKIKNKKLVIKAGKGWKVKRIFMEYAQGQGVVSKNLKNNKKFSAGKHHWIEVTLVNKYTGDTITRIVDSY